MLYRKFGKTGWKVSAIGMGTWNIGNQWGELDDVTSWATVRSAYEHGMNLFDTAESYGIPNGLSEERLGTALAGIRHHVYVISKIGHWGKRTGQGVPKTTVDMIRLCCHASLGRLQTGWLDVVLCHEGDIADPSVYLEAFEMLKQRGRVRAYQWWSMLILLYVCEGVVRGMSDATATARTLGWIETALAVVAYGAILAYVRASRAPAGDVQAGERRS